MSKDDSVALTVLDVRWQFGYPAQDAGMSETQKPVTREKGGESGMRINRQYACWTRVHCGWWTCTWMVLLLASVSANGAVRVGLPLVAGNRSVAHEAWGPAMAAALADRIGREPGFEAVGTDTLVGAARGGAPALRIASQCDAVIVAGLHYDSPGGLRVLGTATIVGKDGRVLGTAAAHGAVAANTGYRKLADSLGRQLVLRLRKVRATMAETKGEPEAWGHFIKACACLHVGAQQDSSMAQRELNLAAAGAPDMPYAWKLMVEAKWIDGESSAGLLDGFGKVRDPARDARWGATLSGIMAETARVSRTGPLYRLGERAAQELPNSAEVHFNLGKALIDVGHIEEALHSLSRALMCRLADYEGEVEPQAGCDILCQAGRAYEYRGDRDRACASFAEPVLLGWYQQDAVLALDELGVRRPSTKDLERIVLTAPDTLAAVALASGKIKSGDMETALEALDKAPKECAEYGIYHRLRARALKALGREKEAAAAEEAAKAAEARKANGEEDDAAGDKELAKLLDHARRCAYETPENDEVVEAYKSVLLRDPLSLEAAGKIGDFFRGRAELERGMAFWKKMIASMPNESQPYLGLAWLHLAKWDAAQEEEEVFEAVRAFDSAFARSRSQAWLLLVASEALADRKIALDKALEWAENARRASGDTPETLYCLGWTLSQMGEHEKAQATLKQAREMAAPPKGRTSLLQTKISEALADTYLRQGYVEEARSIFDETKFRDRPLELSVANEQQREVWCGARVVVCTEGDPRTAVWTYTTPSPIYCTSVSDLDGDRTPECVLGADGSGSDPGAVHALGRSGKRLWRFRLSAKGPYWPDDVYGVDDLQCGDLDQDGRTEVLAFGHHSAYFPSRVCVLDSHGALKGDQWHPGSIYNLATGIVGGRPSIVFRAVNNRLNCRHVVACLDARQVRGKGPTSFEEVASYPGLWYRVLPLVPSERVLRVRVQDNEVHLLSDSGQLSLVLDGTNGEIRRDLLKERGEESQKGAAETIGNWALCIGINAYGRLPRLRYAAADASAVAKALVDCCRFPRSQVTVLTDAMATCARIKAALHRTAAQATDADGILVVFFAGHGFVDRKNHRGYVQPYDAVAASDPIHAIAVEELNSILAKANIAGTVLILDSCHSGAGTFTVSSLNRLNAMMSRQPGRVMLTSCRAEEVSAENERLGHGVFTHYLLEAVRPENWKMDPTCLRVSDLHSYLSWRMEPFRMRRELGSAMRPQTPCLIGNVLPDMVLGRRRANEAAVPVVSARE